MFMNKRSTIATMGRSTRPALRRAWVETGDARCPLACVWSALGHADAAHNEPQDPGESERTRPALLGANRHAGGQAFSSVFHRAA